MATGYTQQIRCCESSRGCALERHKDGASIPIASPSQTKTVICIGDVHGNFEALQCLWAELVNQLGHLRLDSASVVFLGDYNDRGPDTRQVLDWLCKLRAEREAREAGKTVFLTGNHDFGFASYIGCTPADVHQPHLDDTTNPEWDWGFWHHEVPGGMHFVGRMWGWKKSHADTFSSYGVTFNGEAKKSHDDLERAVPPEHKEFLRNTKWVHEEVVDWPPGRVICVHAGLDPNRPAEDQLIALRARDLTSPSVWAETWSKTKGQYVLDQGRILQLEEKHAVQKMHPDLVGKALLVSGHHHMYREDGDRIINDASGGWVKAGRPLEALVLPERFLISAPPRKLAPSKGSRS